MKRFSFLLFFLLGSALLTQTAISKPLIPREIFFGNPAKTMPSLSPNGTKLSYLAPYNGVLNIWVRSIDKDDDTVLTTRSGRGIHSYFWTYDSNFILYVYDVALGAEEYHIFRLNVQTREVTDLTPGQKMMAVPFEYNIRHPEELLALCNKRDQRVYDVYKLDITTTELTLIEQNPGDINGFISDDNLQIRGILKNTKQATKQFFIRNTPTDPWRLFAEWNLTDDSSGPLLLHKDGRTLYLLDSRDRNAVALIKHDLTTGQQTIIASDEQYDVSGIHINELTHEPMYATFTKDRQEILELDPTLHDDLQAIRQVNPGDFSIMSWTNDYERCVVAFWSDTQAASFYLYDRPTKTARFLFSTRPELAFYQLATKRPITIPARDGLTLHGYLSCPVTGEAKNLPLVLLVHGGPWGRDHWGYQPDVQLLANRGYACLQINFRGSSGYGKAFLNAGNKEWGRNMQNDLTDAVNWAVKEGIANPKRVAICGYSYGGYAALCGAAFTPDIFCCAIDGFGICNLLTHFKNARPILHTWLDVMKERIGSPESEEEMLKERSPFFSVDRIKIPLLIMYGENDPRCPPSEAIQIADALKARDIPYELKKFGAEGHGCDNPLNRLAFTETIEKFLAKHLGGRYQEN